MAQDSKSISRFARHIADWALPKAKEEWRQLEQLAKQDGVNELKPWDVYYYANQLSAKTFRTDPALLLPYFEVDQTLGRLLQLLGDIFGLQFVHDPSVPVYHDDVKAYQVSDTRSGKALGHIYLDLYARPNKSSAFMEEVRPRFESQGKMGTAATVVSCMVRKVSPDKPQLLSIDEFRTLIHELGHALHSVTSKSRYGTLAGPNNVPQDSVEIPSKLFELWIFEPEFMRAVARHHITGAPIPEQMLENLVEEKDFMSGLFYLGRAAYTLLDLAWHTNPPKHASEIAAFEEKLLAPYRFYTPIPGLGISQAFDHISTHGYEAVFYSYLWSEIRAVDGFKSFISEGVTSSNTGLRLREEFLSQGNLRDISESYMKFRGASAIVQSLLETSTTSTGKD